MTAPMRGTPRPSAIPATQNTAPVAEFRCLFTPDFRKKQKKWHDGFLKFHSFNNRVMVYDTFRNFIGEAFWKDSNELQEGDELNLDRGGIMVQVEDTIGITHTDLTPLLEKQTRDSPQGKIAPRPPTRPPAPATARKFPRTGSQLRHKSLNSLLGTPKGPIGKAMTMRSPFETRLEKENEWAVERTAKRRKMVHDLVDMTSSSPARAGSVTVNNVSPLWAKTSDVQKTTAPPKSREADVARPKSNLDDMLSDSGKGTEVTVGRDLGPAMPGGVLGNAISKSAVTEETPIQITPKPPRTKIRLPRPIETPRSPPQPLSPPVSASNRLSNVDYAVQPTLSASPPREPKAKTLRLSTGSKRGTLLCQAVPQRAITQNVPSKALTKQGKKKGAPIPVPDPSSTDLFPWPSDDDELLLQINSRSSTTPSMATKEKRKTQPVSEEATPLKKPRIHVPAPQSSPDAFEDMEKIQGFMDARLMEPPSPQKANEVARPMSRLPPSKVTRSKSPPALRTKNLKAPALKKASLQQTTTLRGPLSPAPPVLKVTKARPAKKRNTPENQAIHSISSPAEATSTSHPPTQPSFELQRNAFASLSPAKVAALSTGGFHKKTNLQLKPVQTPNEHTTIPLFPIPAPRFIKIPLPRQSLRTNKSGPPMSTTELSALLQNDPIEDGTQDVTPKRGLKRVRSETDVDPPIPSTSEKWEQQNLLTAAEMWDGTFPAVAASTGDDLTLAGNVKAKAKPSAFARKIDPRKRFQRTVSLNVDTRVGGVGVRPEGLRSVSPLEKVDTDVGPWSTEAFDLFDWRPPVKPGEGEEDKGIGMLVDGQRIVK